MIVNSLRLFPISLYNDQRNEVFNMFVNARGVGGIRAHSIQKPAIKKSTDRGGFVGLLNGNWYSVTKISKFKWRSITVNTIFRNCKNVGFMEY